MVPEASGDLGRMLTIPVMSEVAENSLDFRASALTSIARPSRARTSHSVTAQRARCNNVGVLTRPPSRCAISVWKSNQVLAGCVAQRSTSSPDEWDHATPSAGRCAGCGAVPASLRSSAAPRKYRPLNGPGAANQA